MSSEITRERGEVRTTDGLRLYFTSDKVRGARAAALLIHGFAEHSGRYSGLTARLNARGFDVYRFDLRGHGRSEGQRGHIDSFLDYLRDVAAARRRCFEEAANLPRLLVAHSNGGLVAAHHLARDATGFCGAAFSAPFFGFGAPIPAWKSALARGLSRVHPRLSLPTDIPPEHVSHDPAVIHGYATDPLMGSVASARWLTETLAAQRGLPERVAAIEIPVLFQLAGDDKIVSTPTSKARFEQLGAEDKVCLEYPGLYHEIWFERENARPLQDLLEWLSKRADRSVDV